MYDSFAVKYTLCGNVGVHESHKDIGFRVFEEHARRME